MMKGYKAFEQDLTCLGHQYKENCKHIFDGKPILKRQGFHVCTKIDDCLTYYKFKTNPRFFEVEAGGDIIGNFYDSKHACTELTLIRELSYEEVKEMFQDEESAYKWAYHIDPDPRLKRLIKSSRIAFKWAFRFGYSDDLRNLIHERNYAIEWVRNSGKDFDFFFKKSVLNWSDLSIGVKTWKDVLYVLPCVIERLVL